MMSCKAIARVVESPDYSKRLGDMQCEGLAKVEDDYLILTSKGQRLAKLFTRLQEFARIIPKAGDAA